MKNLLAATLYALAGTTFACAGEAPATATSLLDQCSGTYKCYDQKGSLSFSPYFHKSGDVCMFNSNVIVNADGTTNFGETWTGDAQGFQICDPDGSCYTCTPSASSADAGASGGKCTGTTFGCGEQTPPNCSDVRGCYMATKIGVNNSFDNYCTGTPDSCDQMDNQGDCVSQGCSWTQ